MGLVSRGRAYLRRTLQWRGGLNGLHGEHMGVAVGKLIMNLTRRWKKVSAWVGVIRGRRATVHTSHLRFQAGNSIQVRSMVGGGSGTRQLVVVAEGYGTETVQGRESAGRLVGGRPVCTIVHT